MKIEDIIEQLDRIERMLFTLLNEKIEKFKTTANNCKQKINRLDGKND